MTEEIINQSCRVLGDGVGLRLGRSLQMGYRDLAFCRLW